MNAEALGSTGKPGDSMLLSGVTVVDTRSGQLSPNTDVLLESGRISRIAPRGSTGPGDGVNVVAAKGKFLVPGFLDMHVHSMQDPHPEDSLEVLLAYGVTGVRQMAGNPAMLRRRSEGGLDFGPETPELLSMPGDLLTLANCPTPEAAVAEVNKQQAEGADFIKSIFVRPDAYYASAAEAKRLGLHYGGHISLGVDPAKASEGGMTFVEHLGPLELQLMKVSKAEFLIKLMMKLRPPAPPGILANMDFNSKGMKVMIANPMLIRLSSDPEAIAKTQRLVSSYSDDKARRLSAVYVKNGTWQCPTLIRNESMQFADEPRFTDAPGLRFVPANVRALWEEATQQYREKLTPASRETLKQLKALSHRLLRTFEECGVKSIAGSDYGGGWVIPGVSMHQEFDLLEEAGISPLRILQMTTLNGAEFLKREGSMGTVEAGKDANLVLLDANPVESAQNLHKLHAVVREGRFYDAPALEAIKDRVAARVAAYA